ncbi:MAG TPA: R3H domain-containing nucleic acid-binding protein [Pyrinomonadaceae bacterium]|nr:R3H domain-containing nucleic acid-binding protein [Pyrinomonadaceae bacterium]
MNEACTQAQDFLNAILKGAGLELSAHVDEKESGCFLNIEGADASLLLSEGGELLEALQHILNQAFVRELPKEERIICDVENFRATREAELRAMARHAAERVRTSGVAFTFGPMNANERRVIHMALATEEDLHTESVGEGSARRLKVTRKASPRQ